MECTHWLIAKRLFLGCQQLVVFKDCNSKVRVAEWFAYDREILENQQTVGLNKSKIQIVKSRWPLVCLKELLRISCIFAHGFTINCNYANWSSRMFWSHSSPNGQKMPDINHGQQLAIIYIDGACQYLGNDKWFRYFFFVTKKFY